ncbi:PREDICTED: nicotianamine synthase-like [Ipomoea nil]|uniref:nicotianamine synthase-like n=1 Tax=Ipomoea nil TaxID=35883 RepID=UPI000901842D|nr:PREDICTED: nicotianamine synthase-like [Ipomoea nil]
MNNQQVVEVVLELYQQISRLESLKPSKDVNMLFTKLVTSCLAADEAAIDVSKLCSDTQEMRSHLIKLCGEAEALLETHYSAHLACLENPLQNLHLFPYFDNYIKLCHLEFTILTQHLTKCPTRFAFVGSGPMPLTSIILAMDHFTHSHFHNYDIDPIANALASRLVGSHPGLSPRMFFHTSDIMDVTSDLKDYEVVFLAALVGMDDEKEEKASIVHHLATYMAPGALLVLRSAHGARAFLYPVVDHSHLPGFQILTVHHPVDEVVNSVIVARKKIK